jgi:hypothetical protein
MEDGPIRERVRIRPVGDRNSVEDEMIDWGVELLA